MDDDGKPLGLLQQEILERKAAGRSRPKEITAEDIARYRGTAQEPARKSADEANRAFDAHYPKAGAGPTGDMTHAAEAGTSIEDFVTTLKRQSAKDAREVAGHRMDKADRLSRNPILSRIPGVSSYLEGRYESARLSHSQARKEELAISKPVAGPAEGHENPPRVKSHREALADARHDELISTLEHQQALDRREEARGRLDKADKRNRSAFYSNLPGYRSETKSGRAWEEFQAAQKQEAVAARKLKEAKAALSRLQPGFR